MALDAPGGVTTIRRTKYFFDRHSYQFTSPSCYVIYYGRSRRPLWIPRLGVSYVIGRGSLKPHESHDHCHRVANYSSILLYYTLRVTRFHWT